MPLREGLQSKMRVVAQDLISIHAPARGASVTAWRLFYRKVISIHAPARGASSGKEGDTGGCGFQFMPLREGLQHLIRCNYLGKPISIHAPARGASGFLKPTEYRPLFQFMPLREGLHKLGVLLAK